MKYFLSVDIEGVAGICHRDETGHDPAQWKAFAEQMSREAGAACRAILSCDPEAEIHVRDAHFTARNLIPAFLPKEVRLIREWSGDPLGMMDGIDPSYDACLFIGYHCEAGNPGNPLSHTVSSSLFAEVRVNGNPVSEAHINSLTAAYYGVPLIFVSGDEALCQGMQEVIPGLHVFASFRGKGAAIDSLHPEMTVEGIEKEVRLALEGELPKARQLQKKYRIEFEFLNHRMAFRNAFYPGAELSNPRTVAFEHEDWYEILRCFRFMK